MSKILENLSAVFEEHSEDHAIICGEARLTYRDLYWRAAALAKRFQAEGISNSDSVAVILDNSVDFVLCYFACAIGGFRVVPINPAAPEFQKRYILLNSRPKMIISERTTLTTGAHESLISPGYRFAPDSSLVFYTSGTTSNPKGVSHSFERMVGNVMAFNQLVGMDRDTRMLHIMPMSYMAGFLNTILSPILAGGSLVLAPVFSADMARSFWSYAMRNTVNAMWLSPTMIALLSRLNRSREIPQWTKQNMRQVFVGTASLPRIVKEQFEDTFDCKCFESYGMTEVLLVSSNTKDTGGNGSVGKLLSGVQGRARDANGIDLDDGKTGEVWIKSPYALRGYVGNHPEEVNSPLQNGWFATGDTGFIDPQSGELFITGRIKDIIIHGGVNVSPRAVEEVLMSHDHVRDAVVLGVPHEFWGEEVVAFVMQKNGSQLDKKDLRNHCETKLNADAVPAKYIVLSEFPRTETGKVKKDALRDFL